MKYVISRARSAHERNWVAHSYTLDELYDNGFTFHRESDNKDGNAFVPAALEGTKRLSSAVKEIGLFVFDVDGAQTYDEIFKILEDSGYESFIYTTYSHKTNKTLIRTDTYATWARRNGQPEKHTEDGVKAYLEANSKGHLVPLITKVHTTPIQAADGICIHIDHAPIDKVRILLPMAEPFNILQTAIDSGTNSSSYAHQMWKRTYAGVGKALGLVYDKACMDVTRLHYYPSHPPHAEEFKWHRFNGKLISYKDFQMASAEETLTRTPVATEDEEVIVKNFDVKSWLLNRGAGTGEKIIDALRGFDPNLIRAPRSSDKAGYAIACPYENEHTSQAETDQGTFIDPRGEADLPIIRCSHSHCHGRKTEHFIAGFLENGWITRDELVAMGQRAQMDTAMLSVGLDPSTLGSVLPPAVDKKASDEVDISTLGPAQVDDDQRNIIAQVKEMLSQHQPIPAETEKELNGVGTDLEVRELINKAVEKGAKESRATSIYCLAVSDMSMRLVKMYYGTYASDIGINSLEFVNMIREIRAKRRPLNERIDGLVSSNFQNDALALRLRTLAEYYDTTYTAMYNIYVDALGDVGGESEKELNQMAEQFSKRYGKWICTKSVYLIDLHKLEQDGEIVANTREAARGEHSNKVVKIRSKNGQARFVNAFDYWWDTFPLHQIYHSIEFSPNKPPTPGVLNQFQGFKYKPKAGDPSPINNHILEVWCRNDTKLFNWVTTFLASILQKPGEKFPVALALSGRQGTGKSLPLNEALLPMLRPYAVSTGRREALSGRFNAQLDGKLMFVAEENFFGGDHATASRLKDMISNSTMQIEPKNLEVRTVNNFVRYFFLANDVHSLKLDNDDRRYCVLEVSEKYQRNKEYFKKLSHWLKEEDGIAIWMHFLLNWRPEAVQMSWDDLHFAPRTVHKLEQIRYSLSMPELYLRDMAILGYVDGIRSTDMECGNIAWPLDNECVIPLRKWNMLWDLYLKSQANSARQYVKTHLSSIAQRMFGSCVKLNDRRKVDETEGIRPFVTLAPRRVALAALRDGGYVSEQEYEDAVSIADGEIL